MASTKRRRRKATRSQRKPQQTQRNRQFIGFQAFCDTDQDLIDWWNKQPYGKGSDILRDVLRNQSSNKGDDPSSELINALYTEIQSLHRKIESLSALVLSRPIQVLPSSQSESNSVISEEKAQKRLDNVRKAKW